MNRFIIVLLTVTVLVSFTQGQTERCCCLYNADRPCFPAFPMAACQVSGFTCIGESTTESPTTVVTTTTTTASPTTTTSSPTTDTPAPPTPSPTLSDRCCCEWSANHVCFPQFPRAACVAHRGYPKRCVDPETPPIDRLINAPLKRISGYDYFDDISEPRGGRIQMTSAREISNRIFGARETGAGLLQDPTRTAFTIFWGQFIDHDLSITLFNGPNNCVEEFNIKVPTGDPRFDPESEGDKEMHFCRSDFIEGTGSSQTNPRNQRNSLTPFIDGSQVYGETWTRARKLRTLEGGLMKTSQGADGEFPPINTDGNGGTLVPMINDAGLVPESALFATGDLRGNEQPILLSLHTLWIREHNRRARALATQNPDWSDKKLYEQSRKWTIALIQAITLNEWFEMFVGSSLGPYRGYDSSVDPTIDSFFSTAALRVGHDGITGIILRIDADNQEVPAGHLNLRDGFFFPESTTTEGISSTLRGTALNPAQLMDAVFVDDIRDFLFAIEAYLATDLGARNLQRGREHGIPGYNAVRAAYGLSTCGPQDFSCVTEDAEVAQALSELFPSTDMMDPYVAGLVERRRPGDKIGELFAVAITEQFDRLRHGDKFWFENLYEEGSVIREELESTTLGDIIRRNTDATDISRNVFVSTENPILKKRSVTLRLQAAQAQARKRRGRRGRHHH